MAYLTDYNNATLTSALNTVEIAIIKKAQAVLIEATSGHVNVDAKRASIAVEIMRGNSANVAVRFSKTINAGAGFTSIPTDAQMDTLVASSWNSVAGVTSIDLTT